MTTNKSEIAENLVTGPEVVTGIKAFQVKRVDEGKAAVVTLDGKYHETATSGAIYLAKYPVFKQCKIYYVDTRDRQLTASTNGELTIMHPAPVLVDMSVIITYRVVEPKTVVFEVEKPLGTLFDFTLDAMRGAVQRMKFDDFLVGGQAGAWILQTLRGRDLQGFLGIYVVSVNISHIGPNERVRRLMENEGLRQREVDAELREQASRHQAEMQRQLDEAYNQRDVVKMIELTPEYMALYKPELFTTVFGNRQITDELRMQALIEMAKMGVISPSSGAGGSQALSDTLLGMLGGSPAQVLGGGAPQLPGAIATENARQRLSREHVTLQSGGYHTTLKQLDSGEYVMLVALQGDEGSSLNIYMVCNDRYPASPPQVFVELNGNQEEYQSALLRNWTADQSSIDVVSEVMQYYITGRKR